jgi:integrase
MGRPTHPVGTAGNVRTYKDATGRWRARTTYRDFDGVTREVQRAGRTEAAAKRALAEALRDRVYVGGGDLTADSRITQVAERWYTDLQAEGRGATTLDRYRHELDRLVLPGLGALRIRELTVATADRFLRTIEAKHGAATAKLCRSILSGLAGWAARRDLLDRNPVRDVGAISTKPKRAARALTIDQARDLRCWLTYDDRAIVRDIPDLIDFLLGTGVRIGEAAAVRWLDLDIDAGTVAVTGNIVRVKGKGLIRQETESSKLTVRTLGLPGWLVTILRSRRDHTDTNPERPAFPAPMGGWRDPSNTAADLREAFDWSGYSWVTSHLAGRKTVATLIDVAGLSAREAADQLGHAQTSMVQDHYFGRRMSSRVAGALEAIGEPDINHAE